MPRYELNLRDYYRILRRHLLVIGVVSLGLGGITWSLGDEEVTYQANATVRIRQSSDLTGLLIQTFYWSAADNLDTQIRLITSQPVLLEVAKKLDEYRGEDRIPNDLTLERAISDTISPVLDEIGRLTRKITADQIEYSGLVEIVVVDQDADTAVQIARATAEGFKTYSTRTANERTVRAREFIQEQLQAIQDSLRSTQNELQRYRQRNQALSYSSTATLNPLIDRRTELNDQILILQEQKLRLEEGNLFAVATTSRSAAALVPYAEAFRQLSGLLAERSRLLLTYTEEAQPVKVADDRIEEIRAELIAGITRDIEMLSVRLDDLDEVLATYPEDEVSYAALQRRVDINTQLVTQLELHLQEARIREEEAIEEVQIVNYPMGARPSQQGGRGVKAVIGLLLGLMLGIVVAFIVESMDTSIGTIEDVEEYIEVPVLAVIPHLAVEKMADELVAQNPDLEGDPNLNMYARLITQYDPKSPAAEAYRTLRTNLQFATAGVGEDMEVKNTLLFTSSDLQEGKTTTLVNLAITIAQAGNRVLLMGCNMRRPTIYKSFGIPLANGMTDILTGSKNWRECVKGITDMMVGPLSLQNIMSMPGLDNLHIVTAGGVPPNPSELLNSKRFGQMIEEVRREFDIVLVDCPPILPVTDAAIVGRQVDWAVLIYQVGKVARNALRRAKLHLSNVGAHVLGIAMNDVRAEIRGYSPYSQYMTKYYGEGAEKRETLLGKIRGLFSKDILYTGRKQDTPSGSHRIQGKEESPSWIEVDYFGNGEKGSAEGEALDILPYAAGAGEVSPVLPEETPDTPSGPEAEGAAPGTPADDKPGLLRAVPLWGWIALGAAVVVLAVSLLIGTCSETTAGATVEPTPPAPPAETRPDPTPPVSAGDRTLAPEPVWSIQVGSFLSAGEAAAFLAKLRSRDPARAASAWSRLEEVPGLGRWNRIFIGQYTSREECERIAAHLAESGDFPATLPRLVPPPSP